MLDELRRGENVQNRRLGTWLTETEYESFESDWESQLQIREELNDKPDKLKRYEDKLRKAIFNYTKVPICFSISGIASLDRWPLSIWNKPLENLSFPTVNL